MASAPHIIIAEDNQRMREFITELVELAIPSAVISAFADGQAALEAYSQSGADLVVTDHRMPGMDGITLTTILRRRARLPIVLVSQTPEVEDDALAAGVDRFVDKTRMVQALGPVVRELLGLAP